MKKIIAITSLFAILFCFTAKAQNIELDGLVKKMNATLLQNKQNLPATTMPFIADSAAKNGSVFMVYFNTKNSYVKGSLNAAYIEMLPELLLPVAHNFGASNMQLLAKEKTTNTFKTLDYFGNQPPTPVYQPKENFDTDPSKKNNSNNNSSRVSPTTGSPTPVGALAGKTVWLSPGHGWHNTGSGYTTQRGTSNELVEDFITSESIDYYLMNYLYNAGANVWSVRERDVNTNEAIVDNDVVTSGYTETGSWTTGSIAGYGGTYRVASTSATETATAIFTPNVTSSGLYWVTVRCVAGTNRASDVSFTIIHSGDTSKVKVNQKIHGDTWVHVGQFYFTAGGINKIILSNQSTEAGQVIIADAVRLGGGIGAEADCVNTTMGASGRARFEESARQFARFQGFPSCIEDVTVRPKFSEYELSKGTATEINNAVYVGWHTNAGGGTGTESYSYDGLGSGRPNITAGSVDLKAFIHNQIVADIRAGWRSTWADRGLKVANFGELRELNTIPGVLIELAFHDLAADAADLKNPEFRRLAARAFYKGIVKFFNNRDGVPLVYLPEQPTGVYAKNTGSNTIQLSWVAPVTGGIFGSAATGYKVYVSTNGKSFKDGVAVTGTTFTFTGVAQKTYYFKVTATNAGGESFSSSVIAARTPAAGNTAIPYLIVDAFDRLDASAMIPRTESAVLGSVKRMFLDRMNRYDYMIEHAEALATCGNLAFDGCQNEAVSAGGVLLANYPAVDWFTGEESTVDFSIDATERTLLKAYLNAGGNLLITGSEIGWDIGRAASANVDLDFYNNYLKATFVGDNAGTYNFAGTTTLFNTQTGTFDNATNGYYNVDFPDRVGVNAGSNIALNYVGGTADGAGVGFKGTYNLLYFGFPFEAITSASVRSNLMCNSVAYLTPSALPISGLVLSGINNGAINNISWKTVAEINTKHMIVERSNNGILFNEISTAITPRGSWNNGANYNFTDNNILPSGYYRIKVIDMDGKITYSNTIFLKSTKTTKLFTLLTNPAKDNIKVAINSSSPSFITLYNGVGQAMYQAKNVVGNGAVHSINSVSFAKGIYTLFIRNGTQKQSEKIVVE
jgi:N-acetylmuramoyl-L-alanine amidase